MEINIKKITNKYKSLFFSAYSAAAISFLLSIIRDFVLINYTDFSKQFFELFYFTGFFSLILINFIMINAKPDKIYIIIMSLVASFTIILIGKGFFSFQTSFIILSILVFCFWVCGAIFSRALIVNKKIFLGRIRDGCTSAILVLLCLFNFELSLAVIFSLICTLIFFFIVSQPYNKQYFSTKHSKTDLKNIIFRLIITNLSGIAMIIWAFYMNRSDEIILGYDAYIITRFSIYIYQFIVIGSIIMAIFSNKIIKKNIKFFELIYFVMIIVGLILCVFNNAATFILLPFILGISRYLAIIIVSHNKSFEFVN